MQISCTLRVYICSMKTILLLLLSLAFFQNIQAQNVTANAEVNSGII
jgi:hypothetical protein